MSCIVLVAITLTFFFTVQATWCNLPEHSKINETDVFLARKLEKCAFDVGVRGEVDIEDI